MQRPAAADPIELLRADRARALGQRDPCANLCTLASIDASGQPQARTLVLRDLGGALAVFSNRTSPKWQQLELGGSVAVVVWLPSVNLQYRLQCTTRPVPDSTVHESWLLRPEVPKRLDWFYTHHLPQGSMILDRDTLVAGLSALDLPRPLVAPETAAGRFLEAFTIDRLDLAQSDGIHDRRHFERHDQGWLESLLVP